MEAPNLDTKSLITKLDDVAKTVNLDVSTILVEQVKNPILSTVRSWQRKGISSETKSSENQHCKGLFGFCQEFDRLLIVEKGQLLCYNEPSEKLENDNLRNFSPPTLFLPSSRLGHYKEKGGLMGASKTYKNLQRL